ncbi:hypothetical protein FACS1894217_15560 [Clostridia bacterium]|nr:hypothetical protein FACS1894217_15560 [Clostridia bacterium]
MYNLTPPENGLIERVNGNMELEGMPLTEEDRGRLKTVLCGELTADEMVARLVAKHRRTANVRAFDRDESLLRGII